MANFSDSKQLNISCTIGAIYLPKTGSIQGFQSKSRTRKNPSSSLSQSYIHQAEALGNLYTNKLANISKGTGGIIPKVNLNIGAPACTFAEGSIGPGLTHPVLDKLKGALKSDFIPGVTYNVPTTNIGPAQSSDSDIGTVTTPPITNMSGNGPSPSIFAKKAYSNSSEVYETYNIWTQILPDTTKETNKKFIINLGCQNYEQLGGVHMATQITSADSAQITVHAQQRKVILKRIFPIADDLLYKSPLLSYHNGRPDKRLNIKGGRNCGFHMKFNVSSVNTYSNNSQNVALNSEIIINFGRNSTEKNTISHFSIFLNSTSTFLKYQNPATGNISQIELEGKKLTEGLNQVFVHFAGPNMYIGFNENIEEWNIIEPMRLKRPNELQDYGNSYECRISEKAEIYLILSNLQCSFTYSPICFDNINWENLLTNSNVNQTLEPSNDSSEIFRGQNCVRVRFEASSDNASALQSILPSTINSELQANSSPSKFKDKSSDSSIRYELTKSNDRSKPSVYLDWRAYNSNLFDIKYYQNSEGALIRGSDNPRKLVNGRITYDSDITGSVLFYVRNKYEAEQETTSSLVVDIWNGYNNVTNYLKSAEVTETFENNNQSLRKTTAKLTFVNMTHDNIGRQILNAIQENVLTFTLKAGYGLDLSTYFVGASTKVTVNRGKSGYTIVVDCEDLGYYLLNNIRFPVNNDIVLSFRPFEYILQDCFIFANLDKYYLPRPRLSGFDPLYDEYFPTMSGSEEYQNEVHLKAITAARDKHIIDALKPLLSTMIIAQARGANIGKFMPVLYFDYEKLIYRLTTRGAEVLEYLYFISDNASGRQYLPIQLENEQNIHGLGFGDWKETTDINNLHSKITLIYQDFHSPDVFESDNAFIDSAVGTQALSILNTLVSRTNNVQPYLGYVGFNKEDYYNDINIDSETGGLIQSRALAQKIFEAKSIVARKTYQSLELNVYVNQPLRTYGLFKVQSFEGGVDVESYQEYIFDEVKYNFDIENNLITATITGSYNPDIL